MGLIWPSDMVRLRVIATSAILLAAQVGLLRAAPATLGWQEAVFSVTDIRQWERTLAETGNWERVYSGAVPSNWLRSQGLSDDVTAQEVLVRNTGSKSGYIRLVAFDTGDTTRQIRSNAQTWEAGGWFDVNVRVFELDDSFTELQNAGWSGYADPVQLSFGPFVVEEWLARGPDGVVMALIERKQPPLEGWPLLTKFSRAFNASLITADMDASLEFYKDALGFSVYLESAGPSDEPGANVLGLPHNLADKISRTVFILHPQGTNNGSVELIAFDGLHGRNFSAHAHAPNRGILMLRFPAQDLAALHTRLLENEAEVVTAPYVLTLEPYGAVRIMQIRGPNGELLEFFEQLKD